MNPKEKIQELSARLTEANYRYYVLDDPTMPDFEYDAEPNLGFVKCYPSKTIYRIGEKEYSMKTQHGFARDMDFEVFAQTENSITFMLTNNEETMKKYPYECYFVRLRN